MEQSKNRIKLFLNVLLAACCLGVIMVAGCLLIYESIFLLDKPPASQLYVLTPTLDLACQDYDCLHVCMRQLPDIFNQTGSSNRMVDAGQQSDDIDIIRYKVSSDRLSLELLAVPTVQKHLKKYQNDRDLHQRIWRYYMRVFPETQRLRITYVVFFTDGPGSSLAYIRELGHIWHLYIDIQDFNNQYATTETLVHEFGHMLTLNDSQVTPPKWHYIKDWTRKDFDELGETCSDFFAGTDCAYPGSYLAQFGQRFWTVEIYDSWVETVFLPRRRDNVNLDAVVLKFYQQYPDRFVTRYAATNPVEDLAETWLTFVLRSKPVGETIAEQKVLFFYEFDDLVEIRRKIIQGICKYAAESQ